MTFVEQVKSFPLSFWMVNVMEMLERLAYYGVRVVIPIYIAQADEPMGLHFTHGQKGLIFAGWALVQSLLPMFTGGFADRFGYKKTIAVSITIKIAGYLMMATQREFWPFLIGCLVLAAGTAIFKPGVQGTMAQSLNRENSSVGWGTFYMLVNVGGFLGPPLAHFLYGISWAWVFYGCAIIVSINYLTLLTYKEVSSGAEQEGNALAVLKRTFGILLSNGKLMLFILIMSGFWLMFNQLFDTLPNFIVDWVDSSGFAHLLPGGMTTASTRGLQMTQEWMINLNPALIIVLVVPISYFVSRMRRLTSIFIGMIIASAGLIVAGSSTAAVICIAGILVFSVGEMLSSPKMNEYLGVIAPPGQKGLYMGYANVPNAVGWGFGSWLGGYIYGNMGDKANLALAYLQEKTSVLPDLFELELVGRTESMLMLNHYLGQDASETTTLLWDTYQPWSLWYIFAAVGFASALGMVIYGHYAKRWEDADA